MDDSITVDGKTIHVTKPEKLLWPEAGISKRDYIEYLLAVSPYLLPYTKDRLLMMWRYPDGVGTKRIEEKAVPDFAPDWIPRAFYKDKHWILLNDAATLAWVGNYAALELHVSFDRYWKKNYPTELVFDLDPADPVDFERVLEVALQLKAVLDSLSLVSVAKISGATDLQIYVPIDCRYTFEETRKINKFIAEYMARQNPRRITLERNVKKRGGKLYLDYLQLWKGRTMPAPYSVRTQARATVSMPVTWGEVENGFAPSDFTIRNAVQRIREKGDLFSPLTTDKHSYNQGLDEILSFLEAHRR
ncbi:non-homologous end-joining DNA ligase [Effusibacillus pohliae]|uniref:non-homologous end-joining DNA ligase n=1 Tax=Effusibacillus pohliae TaxID=232270 RepID=UPI00037A6B6F|nr:non-homologous end-joining DNA ligase [Effusibacillus pohliae]